MNPAAKLSPVSALLETAAKNQFTLDSAKDKITLGRACTNIFLRAFIRIGCSEPKRNAIYIQKAEKMLLQSQYEYVKKQAQNSEFIKELLPEVKKYRNERQFEKSRKCAYAVFCLKEEEKQIGGSKELSQSVFRLMRDLKLVDPLKGSYSNVFVLVQALKTYNLAKNSTEKDTGNVSSEEKANQIAANTCMQHVRKNDGKKFYENEWKLIADHIAQDTSSWAMHLPKGMQKLKSLLHVINSYIPLIPQADEEQKKCLSAIRSKESENRKDALAASIAQNKQEIGDLQGQQQNGEAAFKIKNEAHQAKLKQVDSSITAVGNALTEVKKKIEVQQSTIEVLKNKNQKALQESLVEIQEYKKGNWNPLVFGSILKKADTNIFSCTNAIELEAFIKTNLVSEQQKVLDQYSIEKTHLETQKNQLGTQRAECESQFLIEQTNYDVAHEQLSKKLELATGQQSQNESDLEEVKTQISHIKSDVQEMSPEELKRALREYTVKALIQEFDPEKREYNIFPEIVIPKIEIPVQVQVSPAEEMRKKLEAKPSQIYAFAGPVLRALCPDVKPKQMQQIESIFTDPHFLELARIPEKPKVKQLIADISDDLFATDSKNVTANENEVLKNNIERIFVEINTGIESICKGEIPAAASPIAKFIFAPVKACLNNPEKGLEGLKKARSIIGPISVALKLSVGGAINLGLKLAPGKVVDDLKKIPNFQESATVLVQYFKDNKMIEKGIALLDLMINYAEPKNKDKRTELVAGIGAKIKEMVAIFDKGIQKCDFTDAVYKIT